MLKNIIFILAFVILALGICVLCTELDIKQTEKQAVKIELETAKKKRETALVELDNAMYRRWVNQVLYKDVEFKDEWKEELEELKEANGYYEK